MYLSGNITEDTDYIRQLEEAGTDALVLTIDSVAGSNRHRAERFGGGSANTEFTRLTWDYYDELREITDLQIALKGVTSVETAKKAAEHGAPAIVISNHGGRNLDGSPSPLEILLEINQEAPELLDQLEVWADGGVRYGGDVIKLLALGARAVGVGRPYMFANIYGVDGVERVTEILKKEVVVDGGNLGLESLGDVDRSYVSRTVSGISTRSASLTTACRSTGRLTSGWVRGLKRVTVIRQARWKTSAATAGVLIQCTYLLPSFNICWAFSDNLYFIFQPALLDAPRTSALSETTHP